MKKIISILLLSLFLVSCNEEETLIGSGDCFEVSLVSELCGQAVLKIEDPSYYYLGETANDHNNVFYTRLTCMDMGLANDETFYVQLVDEYVPGDCVVCLALLSYSGEKHYDVRRVDVCAD